MLYVLLLPTNTTDCELLNSLNDFFMVKLNWFFCVGVCTEEAAAMTGRLSDLTTRIKKIHLDAILRILSFTEKCVKHLASLKMSPELHTI